MVAPSSAKYLIVAIAEIAPNEISPRIRYSNCQIDNIWFADDPHYQLKLADDTLVAEGVLGPNEPSGVIDLWDYATYPATPLDLILEAQWDGFAPLQQSFTIPASHMACRPVPPPEVQLTAKCDQATVSWEVDTPATIHLFGTDTNSNSVNHSVQIEPGPDSFEWSWPEPQIQGSYPVDLTAELIVEGQVVTSASLTESFSCGSVTPTCDNVTLNPDKGSSIPATGQDIEAEVLVSDPVSAQDNLIYQVRHMDEDQIVAGPQSSPALNFHAYPQVTYDIEVVAGATPQSICSTSYEPEPVEPEPAFCTLATSHDHQGNLLVQLGAVDTDGNPVQISHFQSVSNFDYHFSATGADHLPVPLTWPGADQGSWFVQFQVSVDQGLTWVGGEQCRLEKERSPVTAGQYQDFIGAVPFGTFTPELEPGKEYFDMTRSIMYNVEYLTPAGQGDIVYRFNGQEISGVTSSLFNTGSFHQVDSLDGRALATFNDGVTKLIAYRFGQEQARIFQANNPDSARWIHPLDQPFEFKYDFDLQLHGPAHATDILVHADHVQNVTYNADGMALVSLTYSQPGLVAIYPAITYVTVDSLSGPFDTSQPVSYTFAEVGLYHYQIVDSAGQIVAGPSANPSVSFVAVPGQVYQAQLAYPVTSLFVGLYDDMKFQHPDFWTMPIDARAEHDVEFHLDYHRLPDPDLANDHLRGDVVVDGLTLSYGTTSVAQQFPYGRHDGAQIGVNIVGIPNVSMIAFCQRPGYHEVVYWGGWENEAYYLPQRSWIFDEDLAQKWNEDQRGDCIDAARRVNMELARQGLRTDHTFRHHGQRSQGFQMVQQNVWSPYNLVGMRPPHLGQILTPGTVLGYYENPEDTLFWGWDLDTGGLAEGLDKTDLLRHVASLGPARYVDQTGLHPAQAVHVPDLPVIETTLEAPVAPQPAPQPAAPVAPQPTPDLPTTDPVPEPTIPQPTPEPPTLDPAPTGPTT